MRLSTVSARRIAFFVVLAIASGRADAAVYTVAGVQWDSANSFTDAVGSYADTTSATWPTAVLVGEEHLSFGRLVEGSTGSTLRRATLGAGNNSTRNIVELTFDAGFALPNGVGNDLVVYEQGDANQPEGYAIAVRKYGESTFSDFRYEIWDSQQGLQIATTFDLTDFGLAANEFIDAVQIMNLRQYSAGSLSVFDYTPNGGSGFVLTTNGPAPVGYAVPIGFGAAKDQTIPLSEFDPDITYVGGLHNLVNVAVPEASSLFAVALAGVVSACGYTARRRQPRQQRD